MAEMLECFFNFLVVNYFRIFYTINYLLFDYFESKILIYVKNLFLNFLSDTISFNVYYLNLSCRILIKEREMNVFCDKGGI
jgi:hypothetical protein